MNRQQQVMSLEKLLRQGQEALANGGFDCTVNGKCTQCGACCSNLLPITKGELKRIKAYVKRHKIKLTESRGAAGIIDMVCPFLDTTKETEKCKIYEVRPLICRKYQCNLKVSDCGKNHLNLGNARQTVFLREALLNKKVNI